ncbi:pullulanase-type alpha-1,6-glucosidase [Pseudosporangium ferrugineum]|uniref:1,4-alpha-D-glucan glucanohydrolase n=1 Tax=Pseudosporangium ferrugineum TaxID=439699 RepID=A0A2T0RX24_9ACTN|nr:pullulanase-type alpha-1,6-glucosidase [Pseudosporangium ferrugineum]PRY25708.1 pullulanase-type alpha-1,6-glucosidase [Pseudosporangium ferrugineum]
MEISRLSRLLLAVLLVLGGWVPAPAQAAPPGGDWGFDRPGSATANEQFYFVLPDRFANGDPRNDRGGLPGDRLSTGYDPADKGFYHGGDLKGVIDRLDYIQGMGTTAIWLAPVFKNRPVQGSGSDVSAGYHGYWITDFTQVDPHFGTNADLKRLVGLAHKRGMKIYLDIIVNHTADVIKYAEDKYAYVDKATKPYRDAQGRTFEDRNYADGTRAFPAVNAKSFPYTPVVDAKDSDVKVPRWLNDPLMYHNRGDTTFVGENSEYGDFFGLDDLWTERPEVVRGMTKIYADWIRDTGIDGYRLDTVKHSNLDFWPQFSAGIEVAARNAGKPGFFMFGEVYSADQEIESTYVRRGGLPATLDFSFQDAAKKFTADGGSAKALSDLYAKDDLYTTDDTSADRLPTFLGNHDMGRIGSFIAGGGTDPATHLRRDQLAHELMFLTRGQPVIYSGDEQGFTGPGGDKDARQDMFASRTPDYLDDDLLGTDRTHAQANYETQHPVYRTIASLGALRKAHPALRDGSQVTRYAADGPGIFAASRIDRAKRQEYVIAVNNATTAQTVTVETWTPGSPFQGIYGGAGGLTSGADGKLTITVPALSAVAYRAGRAIPPPAAAPGVRITSPEAGAFVPTRTELTAAVTGDPLATVRFEAKVGDGQWRTLGTADTAPYRVYHDLTGLAGATPVTYRATVRDSKGRTASTTGGIRVGTPVVTAGPDYAVVHYQRPDGDYDDWGLYAFGDIDESAQTTWPAGQPFAGVDAYGRFAWVKLKPGAKNVGFIVVDKNGTKDVAADRFLDPTVHPEVWLKQGDAAVGTEPPPVTQDQDTAVIHYRRAAGDYTGWGLHVWDGAANPTEWSAPLAPASVDSFGATFRVPLAAGATGLNYILHNGDTKDLPADQRLDFASAGREVWLLAGVPDRLLPVVRRAGAGGTVDLTKSAAVWLDRSTIAWKTGTGSTLEPVGAGTDGRVYDLIWAPGGGLDPAAPRHSVRLRAQRNGLTEAQRQKFPHLWQYGAFTLPRGTDVRDIVRGQVAVTERDAQGTLLSATGVQTAGVLDDVYAAATGARLGPTFDGGRPRLAVWAPTAQSVRLELSDTPGGAARDVAMVRDSRTGVWSVAGAKDWKGKFYRYRVTAWQPVARKVVTASVTDPYSVALSANSTHSQIADLADPALAPAGWDRLRKPAPGKIQISELSVRDFSAQGTYAAFTDPGSAGMKQLGQLARAGTTYVHLLPVFDFATIPERRADQKQPACDLAALPPDSAEQQKCVAAVADADGYNWGYDPLHYTTPEGGYATNPEGAARTREFRQMVAGLNGTGLRVVMDVVYNHTSAAGTDPHSVLDQIVPGYYQRLLEDGSVANSTCCANTAPENAMMGKLVVDSVVTWAKAYKVDGFRFDLMGHHPKANILAVRAALDKLTVARDGVDGKKIYVYGEGWDFGEVAGNARFVQATQANLAGTGIGTFNDRLRDAVRGGGPFDDNPRVQGFGSGLFTAPNGDPVNGTAAEQRARLLHYQDLIKVGLSGNLAKYTFTASDGTVRSGAQIDYNGSPAGYNARPVEAITYVDAHDNEILYDALAYKLPQSTPATDRARMQALALATTALGQGPGFVTAGSERLRSKSLDRNSFNSGDWFNRIEWDCAKGNGFGRGLPPAADNEAKWPYAKPLLADPALKPDCAAIGLADATYRELLEIRGSSPVFGLPDAAEVQKRLSFPLSGTAETPGVLTMTLDGRGLDKRWKSVTVVFNATPAAATQRVGALRGADVALHPVQRTAADPALRTASFAAATGTFSVPARSVAVFVQR